MTKPPRVIGSCWACKGPVRAHTAERIKDPSTGTVRLVHQGACADRASVLIGPVITGQKGRDHAE